LLSSTSDVVSDNISVQSYRYAVVEHGDVYMKEMAGLHGKQLGLAYQEWKRNEGKYLPDDLLDKYSMSVEEIAAARASPLLEPAEQGESEIDVEIEEEQDDEGDENEGEEFDENHLFEKYNPDGSLKMSTEDRLAYQAGAPAGGSFAIIHLNGCQHKVALGDVVIQNKLKPVSKWKVGETVTLEPNEILLVGSSERTLVGLPGIPGASVKVLVEEITRDATVIIFKKRRKKHSQRKRGFRREITMLRVVEIQMPEPFKSNHVEQLMG